MKNEEKRSNACFCFSDINGALVIALYFYVLFQYTAPIAQRVYRGCSKEIYPLKCGIFQYRSLFPKTSKAVKASTF